MKNKSVLEGLSKMAEEKETWIKYKGKLLRYNKWVITNQGKDKYLIPFPDHQKEAGSDLHLSIHEKIAHIKSRNLKVYSNLTEYFKNFMEEVKKENFPNGISVSLIDSTKFSELLKPKKENGREYTDFDKVMEYLGDDLKNLPTMNLHLIKSLPKQIVGMFSHMGNLYLSVGDRLFKLNMPQENL